MDGLHVYPGIGWSNNAYFFDGSKDHLVFYFLFIYSARARVCRYMYIFNEALA